MSPRTDTEIVEELHLHILAAELGLIYPDLGVQQSDGSPSFLSLEDAVQIEKPFSQLT